MTSPACLPTVLKAAAVSALGDDPPQRVELKLYGYSK